MRWEFGFNIRLAVTRCEITRRCYRPMYSFVTNSRVVQKKRPSSHTHTHSVIRVDVLTVCDLVGFNMLYWHFFLSFLQDLVFTSTGSSLICHTDVVIHSRRSSTQTFRPCQPTQPPSFYSPSHPGWETHSLSLQKHLSGPYWLPELSLSLAVWNKSRFLYAVTLFSVSSNGWQKSETHQRGFLLRVVRCWQGSPAVSRNKLAIQNERLVLCVALSTSLVYLSSLTPWQIFCSADHDPGGE